MNLNLILDMAADALGDAPAISAATGALSYVELRDQTHRAAAWLAEFDATNTVYLGGNDPAFVVAIFASALLGRPFASLNYRLADADLRRILARTAPCVAIVDDELVCRAQCLAEVTVVPRSAFSAAIAAMSAQSPPECEGDIAVLLFTSGTTGDPKAAVLRHGNLTSYVLSTVDFMSAADDLQSTLISVPPYHIAGISSVLTSLYAGRRIVQLNHFTPESWLDLARRERVTHAMVVPTMLSRIIETMAREKIALPSLRHLSYGGGRMPISLIEQALDLMPQVDFVNAYGLTETSSTVAVLSPEDHRAFHRHCSPENRRRLGSVGRPLPAIELQISGPAGEPLAPGEVGEIWVRGPQVSGEYIGRKAVRDDGWFPTNDSGWLDDEGYLFINGRLDDVIVRGGENISPGEIEDVLRTHPGVDDAAVIGLPDDQWGERVVAVVVASQRVEASELQKWVGDRLRSTKAPEAVHFREELPYNETGKLLRRVLKAELIAALDASSLPEVTEIGHPPDRIEAERFCALGGEPMVSIEVSTRDVLFHLSALRERTQAITVGHDDHGRIPEGLAASCDILLTVHPLPPRPWVSVADMPAALRQLRHAIGANPIAAWMAARILQISEALPFGDALTVESLAYSSLLGGAEFRRWRAAHPPRRNRPPAEGSCLTICRDGDHVQVSLNRPQSRNAVDADMRDALVEAIGVVLDDPSAPRLTLRGAGLCFSSGGDLDEFGEASDLALAHIIRTLRSPAALVHALGTRAAAFIHGACIGAGVEIGAAAARRVASEDAFFQLPELSMGLAPGAGGTVTLPRVIGRHRTCFMALSGARISVHTALAWGLVQEVRSAP
jgi:fatty-acyl-CoA synthase